MGEPCEILVLVDEDISPRQVLRNPRKRGERLEIRRWGRLKHGPLSAPELRAVVFQPGAGPKERRHRQSLLRDLPDDVTRISLRVRGEGENGFRPASELEITAPVDLRMLRQLIARERRCRELEESRCRALSRAMRTRREFRLLSEMVRVCNSELEPDRILEVSLLRLASAIPFSAWSVFLRDEDQSSLTLSSARRLGGEARVGLKYDLHCGLAGQVMKRGTPLRLTRAKAFRAKSGYPELPFPPFWFQALGLPLVSRGKILGVVELFRERGQPPFSAADMRTLSGLLGPVSSAIDHALLLRKAASLSVTDDLTGLYNARFLHHSLGREVQRSKRYGGQVSVLFLDLDCFKTVNDRFGHLAGSQALVEVGVLLRETLRGIDVVSRFGGDEFTVILPQTGAEGAGVIAERIRHRIEKTLFLQDPPHCVNLTASIGIACFPDHGQSKDQLIQKSDEAMYRVKERGKNGIELAD